MGRSYRERIAEWIGGCVGTGQQKVSGKAEGRYNKGVFGGRKPRRPLFYWRQPAVTLVALLNSTVVILDRFVCDVVLILYVMIPA